MTLINNVDIDKVKAFGEQLKIDHSKARKTQVIEGEWLLKEGGAQFQSSIWSWRSTYYGRNKNNTSCC